MLNRIIIMGRLGDDPKVRYTQGGTPVASFSLAVDRDFKDQTTGERITDCVPVVAWNAKAKFVEQYFTKGQMAVVEGRLQVRDWTDKDGGKRRSYEVVADNVYFGGAKSDGAAQNKAAAAPAPQKDNWTREADESEEEELPF